MERERRRGELAGRRTDRRSVGYTRARAHTLSRINSRIAIGLDASYWLVAFHSLSICFFFFTSFLFVFDFSVSDVVKFIRAITTHCQTFKQTKFKTKQQRLNKTLIDCNIHLFHNLLIIFNSFYLKKKIKKPFFVGLFFLRVCLCVACTLINSEA